jgi:G3E family GTPase
MTQQSPMPVTVIGGYLGSGKTTLVNHLLRNANGRRLAILVNEFGELPIDADLIEADDGDVISLTGGCVCCSYGNDLMMALMDMAKMEPRPDHIILESSGVALPGAIAGSVSLLNDYVLDGILVLADAGNIEERANDKYMSDTILRQLADADIVLLNKTDLIADEQKGSLVDWLREKSGAASILETQNSILPIEIALQSFTHDDGFSADRSTHSTSQFETKFYTFSAPTQAQALAQELAGLSQIVRAKGFVPNEDGKLKTLQIVGQSFEITPAPENVEAGLVVIGVKPLPDLSHALTGI